MESGTKIMKSLKISKLIGTRAAPMEISSMGDAGIRCCRHGIPLYGKHSC